ncbi:universal stress protein [Natrarchaeobaculum sulfurireducens]|uniref:Nucleotide-binding protein, UspA family n=1 Tax=Natrarchaeobaculum sulfurireducens TaxID=2044521 RepID=A0A346PEW2_9EURY|nr:universal stress protein [Natrarchaeobaculum sulfurireducens]AXR78057.1 Nucleotide-binding protein, UspA family [Natrarchaeobaculum sulfurireducens]AXR81954.1 Universal stress protein [Natrarchaeobaculum sulfurireducens]
MTLTFDDTVIVPLADPDDAERTATALAAYVESSSTVVLVNVIEKGGGAIDKAPLERRKEYAEEIYERAREALADSPATVETATLYGTDVVETIFEAAEEREADAVVFNPRKGNRIAELLTGDVARRLVREAKVPVVTLPK